MLGEELEALKKSQFFTTFLKNGQTLGPNFTLKMASKHHETASFFVAQLFSYQMVLVRSLYDLPSARYEGPKIGL